MTHRAAVISIVDDAPANVALLTDVLVAQGYQVTSAYSGSMALLQVRINPPDLILLDIRMPGLDGYEVCRQLKSQLHARDIPVIFISAVDEAVDKVKAFDVGGADYVTKPFQMPEVLARIEHQLALVAAKREIEHLNAVLEERVRERTAQLQSEIEERQRVEAQLMQFASRDALTDLPNRVVFAEKVAISIARLRQQQISGFAVFFLDCDRFKMINDSLGHLLGDCLLIKVAQRLRSSVDERYVLSRFGGDEFTLLADDIDTPTAAIDIAQQLQSALLDPFALGDYELFVRASIGIALGTSMHRSPEHVLRDADIAMYRAKAIGGNRIQVFDLAMLDTTRHRLQLENDLQRAIANREFVLHYQPILSLVTGRVAELEALIRWEHPQLGWIAPNEFIPIAEDTGAIVAIGEWVLQQACQQLREWHRVLNRGADAVPTLRVAVNVSAQQFARPELLDHVDRALSAANLGGEYLKVEMTETAVMENPEVANSTLEQIKERHMRLSLDDFGTGYSSLSYLHRFPVDALKIDRSFVSGMDNDTECRDLVEIMMTVAQKLGVEVIAEGIETPQQLARLQQLGCQYGQGYYFSKPLPPQTVAPFIELRASAS
ncbi:MAG: EAL domain-containing protein [Cyanobacteria bacterium P01_D01_bin.123]